MPIKIIIQASLLIAAAILMAADPASAGHGKILTQTGCACCPVCDHVCKLDAEQVDEEKTCFEVESKAICIPRVVFPWQKKSKRSACASCDSCDGVGCTACVHNGARVRKVCVLKTEKYKCPACKYTWTAEKKDTCGGCCGGGPACDGGCICEAGCDSGYIAPISVIQNAPETDPTVPPAPVPTQEPATTDKPADGTTADGAKAEYDRSAGVPIYSKPLPLARLFK